MKPHAPPIPTTIHLTLAALVAPLLIACSTTNTPSSDSSSAARPTGIPDPHLRFPAEDHLTPTELYQMGNPASAIHEIIGRAVLLDVVVVIARDVPLVHIEIPSDIAASQHPPDHPIWAHLISATTIASSLKEGERLRIEGVIVDEGYSAYTIYLHNFQLLKH
ncbi:MAG: hypothetical protein ACTS3F_12260 [Phycisphaerales bacterium]